MNTTFGIRIANEVLDNPYMRNTREYREYEEENSIIIPIAFRSKGIRFINPIAHLLPDTLEVIAIDNSHQGIQTIGDIKHQINKDYVKQVSNLKDDEFRYYLNKNTQEDKARLLQLLINDLGVRGLVDESLLEHKP